MTRMLNTLLITLALAIPTAGMAGPREDVLNHYATAAKAATPGFAGFSAARGEAMHTRKFAGGKPDTPACTACHANDPRSMGRNPSGKPIDPVAVSASPARYTDLAKTEKWFRRNCNEVLGRECTPLEKGDWLSYMISR